MVKRCAVPGCKSGYPAERKRRKQLGMKQISFFFVPKNQIRLEKWNTALGLPIGKLSFTDAVCQLHFKNEDVKTHYVTIMPDGSKHTLERGRYLLKDGAVPVIALAPLHNDESDIRHVAKIPAELLKVDPVQSIENTHFSSRDLDKKDDSLVQILEGEPDHEDDRKETNTTEIADTKVSPPSSPPNDKEGEYKEPTVNTTFDDSNEGDVKEHKNLEDVSDVDEYSLDLLSRDLDHSAWRQNWIWSRTSDPAMITFVQFDTTKQQPRVQCSIDTEMNITISVGDKSVFREINGNLKSFDELTSLLDKLERIVICEGTGRDEERRAPECPGFPELDNLYRKKCGFERCFPCRALRHRLQKRRTLADLVMLKSMAIKKLDLLQRRHKTLQKTVNDLKIQILELRKRRRQWKESFLKKEIKSFSEDERDIETCFASSKAGSNAS